MANPASAPEIRPLLCTGDRMRAAVIAALESPDVIIVGRGPRRGDESSLDMLGKAREAHLSERLGTMLPAAATFVVEVERATQLDDARLSFTQAANWVEETIRLMMSHGVISQRVQTHTSRMLNDLRQEANRTVKLMADTVDEVLPRKAAEAGASPALQQDWNAFAVRSAQRMEWLRKFLTDLGQSAPSLAERIGHAADMPQPVRPT